MNRVHTIAFRLFAASFVLLGSIAAVMAQGSLQPAPPLPEGMTGSNAADPRAKLTPGLYDAGEAAMGIKHISLIKKPDAFQLGTDNADDPRVQKSLGVIGIGDSSKIPKGQQLVLAQLAFA